jgi:hypothetical protein
MYIRNHRFGICDRRLGIRNPPLGICDPPLGIHNPPLGIRNRHVGIDYQLGLEGGPLSSRIPGRLNQTHIEHLKDPDQILLPTRNLVLVVLGEDESKD